MKNMSRLIALLKILGAKKIQKAIFIKGKLVYYYGVQSYPYYEELVGVFDEHDTPIPFVLLKGKLSARGELDKVYWKVCSGSIRNFTSIFGAVRFKIVVPAVPRKLRLVIAKYIVVSYGEKTKTFLEGKKEHEVDDLRRFGEHYGFEVRDGEYDFNLSNIDYAASLLMRLIEYFVEEASLQKSKHELYRKLANELLKRSRQD